MFGATDSYRSPPHVYASCLRNPRMRLWFRVRLEPVPDVFVESMHRHCSDCTTAEFPAIMIPCNDLSAPLAQTPHTTRWASGGHGLARDRGFEPFESRVFKIKYLWQKSKNERVVVRLLSQSELHQLVISTY